MATQKKSGKKHRKHGRNKKWCEAYRLRRQRERNKVKRLKVHLTRFPTDKVAKAAVDRAVANF
jgi:hypothetical protein